MPVEGKTAFEIRLNGKRARTDKPGSVWILRGEEKIHASAVHAVTSHLVLPPGALERLQSSGLLASVGGTDSHPGSRKLAGTPGALSSFAPLLMRAIERAE